MIIYYRKCVLVLIFFHSLIFTAYSEGLDDWQKKMSKEQYIELINIIKKDDFYKSNGNNFGLIPFGSSDGFIHFKEVVGNPAIQVKLLYPDIYSGLNIKISNVSYFPDGKLNFFGVISFVSKGEIKIFTLVRNLNSELVLLDEKGFVVENSKDVVNKLGEYFNRFISNPFNIE